MDDILIRGRLNTPVHTGRALEVPLRQAQKETAADEAPSFKDVLKKLQDTDDGLSFSKHAANRLEERGVLLSEDGMRRLNNGFHMAREKGLSDTLILMDNSAFVVNVGSGRVITSLSNLQGKIITNIDGTVIV